MVIKNQMPNKTTNRKGYTLIEIMVGIAIFMIVMAAPVGLFVNSLKAQQKVLFSQRLMDNVSYSLEYMSRALRMARKDTSGVCIAANTNFELTRNGKGIKFLNYSDVCQEFYWDDVSVPHRLQEVKSAVTLPLTSDDLDILSFKIGPSDSWDQDDNEQPKVTLYLEAKGIKSQKTELQPQVKVQTTISQRNIDVTY